MNENKQASAAFVKAQQAFSPAIKCATNPRFQSKYADLAACVEAVMDALNANGLALQQLSHEREGGVAVETRFVHESGECLDCGVLFVPASKRDAQGYGSALTYARRYSLMAACGIAPEDDDGNKAVESSNKTKPPQQKQTELKAMSDEVFGKKLDKWFTDGLTIEQVQTNAKTNGYQFTPAQIELLNQKLPPF